MKRNLQAFLLVLILLLLQVTNQVMAAGMKPAVDSTIYCHALYSWQADSVNVLQIQFTDESFGTGTVIAWEWNFGDPGSGTSNTSSLQNPTHTFTVPGYYNVCLIIHTSDGCTSDKCDVIHVGIWCEAGFTYQADTANEQLIYFTDASVASDSIIAWEWNFGDPASGVNNVSTLQNTMHIYTTPGNYYVCHSIATSGGCTGQTCDTIVVGTPCNAEFEYAYDSINPMTIHFWPVGMPSGTVERWIWDFGDGTPNDTIEFPENPNITHTYAGPSMTHTVCLFVQTLAGSSCHHCESVTPGAPCNAHYHFQAAAENPLHVHFWDDNMPAGTVAGYQWDFGDGSPFGTTPDPWHIYSAAGKYNVCLIIETIWGTTCDYCDSITVHSTVDLNGHVTVNGAHADSAMVYLIRIDSINGMTVIDSTAIQDSSAFYHFGGVLPGSYYTRAILLPSSAYFGEYAPTYHESALLWQDANEINPGGAGYSYNIHMIEEPNYPSGNGTISGNISEGTKLSQGGTPAPGVVVLIFDATDQILYSKITDSEGNFIFPEIAEGTYKVYPESPGKTTTPATVMLDQTNLAADLSFVIKGNKILLGVNGPATLLLNFVSEIYPNPAVTNASLSISALHETQVTLSVISITGETVQTIYSQVKSGTNKLSWNIPQLNSGIYFVRISDNSGGQVVRKLVLTR